MCEREKELISNAKNGDERSFEILMEANYQKVFNLAFRLMRNEEDAYELTSDTFIRAYRNIKSFRGNSSFWTYLYRICLNCGINRLKRQKPTIPINDAKDVSVAGPMENHRNLILKEAIENALSQLSPRERAIFLMRQYEDMPIKEIALSLNLKEGTVKSTYFHAMEKMRSLLAGWV